MSEDFEILPTVLVIHPSGYTEFLDADMSSMTSSEIESLIYGEDLAVAHSSEHLERITNECSLEKNLVMYFVKKAATEDIEDNYVGSLLYDGDAEVRGPIIIALEALASITSDSLIPPTPPWITLSLTSSFESFTSDCFTASTEP